MKDPEGKSHYSVDEMMERLKDVQAAKEGRSRRRRSYQPTKKRRRTLMVTVVAAVVLVLLTVGGMIAWAFFSRVRYEGDGFRREVSQRVGEIAGMNAEFAAFSAGGRRLASKQAALRTPDGRGVVKEVQAEALAAELRWGSFFGANWIVNPLDIQDLTVVVGLPEDVGAQSASGAAGIARLLTGGFGLSPTPEEINLGTVRVREFNLGWTEGRDRTDLAPSRLEKTPVSAEVFGDSVKFQGGGGVLTWGLLGQFRVGMLAGEARGTIIDLQRMRLTKTPQDEIILSGRIDLRTGGDVDLKGTMSRLALREILPANWMNLISGDVDSEFAFARTLAPGEPLKFSGSFTVRSFILRNLPALESLAILTTEPGFSLIEIPSIKGTFELDGDALVISNFEALRSGLVRLDGRLTIGPAGELGGTVELGLPAATFESLVGGRPDYFVPRDDGFAYVTVNLGGTLAEPVEDLTERLQRRVREMSTLLEQRKSAIPGDAASGGVPAPAPRQPQQPSAPAPVPPPTVAPDGEDSTADKLEDTFEQLIR